KIIAAGIEGRDLVGLAMAHGQHNDGRLGIGPQRPAGRQPSYARHVQVEHNQVRPELPHLLQRLFSTAGIRHLVAGAAEGGAQHPPNLRLIVHDQHPPGAHAVSPLRCGSHIRNRVSPGRLCTVRSPPWARAMVRAMPSPSPEPGICSSTRGLRYRRSKMRSCSAGAMPAPWSVTVILAPAASPARSTTTGVPGGEYLKALSSN